MGLTGGAALKKGGKVQEFVIPQQVLAATLPTSSPHPYVPWWDVRKVSKGVEGWGLLPTALPLSVPSITSCLSITWQAGGDGG